MNRINIKFIGVILLAIAMQIINVKLPDAGVNFEILNSCSRPIQFAGFTVKGGTIVENDFPMNATLSSGEMARAKIRVDDPNQFAISINIVHGVLKQQNKYIIRPGTKTAFVSFNADKFPSLYPQTGNLGGLSGKSKSGLSTKNNLKATNIEYEK